jgi:hypothetical protein
MDKTVKSCTRQNMKVISLLLISCYYTSAVYGWDYKNQGTDWNFKNCNEAGKT